MSVSRGGCLIGSDLGFRFVVGEKDNRRNKGQNRTEEQEQCPGLVCVYFIIEDLIHSDVRQGARDRVLHLQVSLRSCAKTKLDGRPRHYIMELTLQPYKHHRRLAQQASNRKPSDHGSNRLSARRPLPQAI